MEPYSEEWENAHLQKVALDLFDVVQKQQRALAEKTPIACQRIDLISSLRWVRFMRSASLRWCWVYGPIILEMQGAVHHENGQKKSPPKRGLELLAQCLCEKFACGIHCVIQGM
jgi:hypothetical protein